MNDALVIRCPACDAGYLLPRHLLGPLGARVTCPACRRGFDVDARGALAAEPPEASVPALRESPGSGAAVPGWAVAREVLDELAGRLGPALDAAARSGRLLAAHGPDLMRAFDDYRARAGGQADPRAFHEELRRRWRLDLGQAAGTRR